jgi:hypothetical protein
LPDEVLVMLETDETDRRRKGNAVHKVKLLLVATLMAVPTVGMFAPPASACMGEVCEAINTVCIKVTKGTPCVK